MSIMDIAISPSGWTAPLRDHLLSLTPRDRRMRFMSAVSDVGIKIFCDTHTPESLISATENGVVIGIAEVHMSGDICEIALSVNAERRGEGIGARLFAAALDAALASRARQARVYYARGNTAVRKMCQRHGARISSNGGEEDAVIELRTC